jgi:hypothetical protein
MIHKSIVREFVVLRGNWRKVTKRWNKIAREHKRGKEDVAGWGEKRIKT